MKSDDSIPAPKSVGIVFSLRIYHHGLCILHSVGLGISLKNIYSCGFMYICMPKCMYMYHGYMQIFEKAEDFGAPRLDFTGGCEPPYVGAVN